MDTLLPLLCLLTGSVLTLVVLGLLVRRAVRQLAVANAYREVAQQLGLEVDTRGVSVRGHLGDRRIWIGEVLESYGPDRRTEVRGVIALERPLGLGLVVRRRGRTDRLFRRGRAPELAIGDPDLDRILHVHGDDPERVRALFTPEVKQSLRHLATHWPDVVLTDEELQVWLRQPEATPEELSGLVAAMLRAVEAAEAARRDVTVPEQLDEQAERWTRLASRFGLEVEPWLPAVRGVLEGHRVLIVVQREAEGYAATLRLWFNPHPDLGLLLRPQVEPDGYWSVGQDIQVGDPAFDEAFVIKGYDPGAVRARLSDPARRRLLDLLSHGPVVVDDRGLVLRGLPLDADEIAPAIEQAVGAARAIGW